MKRRVTLENNKVYHIFSRSIAHFEIFNEDYDYLRFYKLIKYYQFENERRFSHYLALNSAKEFEDGLYIIPDKNRKKYVQIVAYCLMPTHIHLLLKQISDNGISKFCGNILNSYSRYFNEKHRRKGPLWESKFKNVGVSQDDVLLHLTRYIHLNPVTAYLVKRPSQWQFSSYNEYINKAKYYICEYQDLVKIDQGYKKFVLNQRSYQRELGKLKKLVID